MINKDSRDDNAVHLITCPTFFESGEVIETLHRWGLPVANFIKLQRAWRWCWQRVLPSVTDRGPATINAVPMDLSSNLHRELANLTRPDQCILYLCWFGNAILLPSWTLKGHRSCEGAHIRVKRHTWWKANKCLQSTLYIWDTAIVMIKNKLWDTIIIRIKNKLWDTIIITTKGHLWDTIPLCSQFLATVLSPVSAGIWRWMPVAIFITKINKLWTN